MKLFFPTTGKVLLSVTGLSCQVVTETLYALAQEKSDQFPDTVYILTTQEGEDRAKLLLLQEGWLRRFLRDWKLPPIQFTAEHIQTITDKNGQALSDIRTPEDNLAAADFIAQAVQQLTVDSEQLHVSIAGGRKTMGFFAGYALTLYGRKQDRLSHVLVSSEFESHPEFYYPTPYPRVIHTPPPASKPLDTQTAEVSLADIPFLRLREQTIEISADTDGRFYSAVAELQRRIDPPRIIADCRKEIVFTLGDFPLHLQPLQATFYFWMLQRQKAGKVITCPTEGVPNMAYAHQFLCVYKYITSNDPSRTQASLKDGMTNDFFSQTKSSLTRVIKDSLPQELNANAYIPKRERAGRIWMVRVPVDNDKITLLNGPSQAWET
jgi:CRISPR-associated protein, NE0113 family